jgi:hypothetical protein
MRTSTHALPWIRARTGGHSLRLSGVLPDSDRGKPDRRMKETRGTAHAPSCSLTFVVNGGTAVLVVSKNRKPILGRAIMRQTNHNWNLTNVSAMRSYASAVRWLTLFAKAVSPRKSSLRG